MIKDILKYSGLPRKKTTVFRNAAARNNKNNNNKNFKACRLMAERLQYINMSLFRFLFPVLFGVNLRMMIFTECL